MKDGIKLYRIILNILFYIFYVILISVAFSLLFPTILVVLGQNVIAPNNPIFDSIQIIIIILTLFFSFLFRKFFYLPIKVKVDIKDFKQKTEIKKNNNKEKIKKINNNVNNKEKIKEEAKDENIEEELELDIKIGKEIK